jgi:uncharacterized membrane protein
MLIEHMYKIFPYYLYNILFHIKIGAVIQSTLDQTN